MIFDTSKFAPIWAQATGELLRNPLPYAAPIAVVAASGIAFDHISIASPNYFAVANFGYQMVALVTLAWVIGLVMRSFGRPIAPPEQWRIGALFVLALLTSLAMLLGLIALVLPLFYLAGRWYVAATVMLVERLSVTEAMQRSWDLLETHWLSAALLFLVCIVGRLAPLSLEAFLVDPASSLLWPVRIAANLVSETSGVLSIIAGTCLYLDLTDADETAAEIFG